MSHRMQITLTDEQYERLRRESRRTGLGLAALVRRALDRSYGEAGPDDALRALEETYGAWGVRRFDGAGNVDRFRRGMAHRLER